MLRLRRLADDLGAAVVLSTVLLTVMIGFSALVIDLGNAWQVRRQAQGAADAAALAAARSLIQPDPACGAAGRAHATCVARRFAEINFGVPAAAAGWTGCPSPAADDPRAPEPSPSTTCVSFDADDVRVRVRVPARRVPFTFARLLGFESADVGAFASAQIQSPGDREIPLGILAGPGATGLLCVEQEGGRATCPDGASGNFGSLSSPRYRTFTTAGPSDRDGVNFAVGMDHVVRTWTPTAGNLCDTDNRGELGMCQAGPVFGDWNNDPGRYDQATWAFTAQGNNLKDPTAGLVRSVSCCGGVRGRLQRPDGADSREGSPVGPPASPAMTVLKPGVLVGGRHIAAYMTTPAGSAARAALWGAAAGSMAATATVNDPFWDSGNAVLGSLLSGPPSKPLFSGAIVESQRFGFVPVIDAKGECTEGSFPSGGSGPAKVCDVLAIYIDRLYTNDPKDPLRGGTKVMAVRAWVFDPALIESSPAKPGSGMPYVGGPFLTNLVK